MAKEINREGSIYIAPQILGWFDENEPKAYDESNQCYLDLRNVNHKAIIYERQVRGWFLNPAKRMMRFKKEDNGFVVLMICFSYLEGLEQLRVGKSSKGDGSVFFRDSLKRLYIDIHSDEDLGKLYGPARCGLFHDGMTRGSILVDFTCTASLNFSEDRIRINPKKLLNDIEMDFNQYVHALKFNGSENLKENFNKLYTHLPTSSS